MRKFLVLTTAFVFAGISFAQQTQSDGSREQNPAGSPKHQHRTEWCKQNWEKCKQIQLKMLSAKKECLEKSQSYEAFRNCMAQFREQRKREMKGLKQD
jgi:predicted nucleotide-binding protein (sugar kinase/HSP70/actin superfamily)